MNKRGIFCRKAGGTGGGNIPPESKLTVNIKFRLER